MAEEIKNNQNFTGIVVDDGTVRESIRNKHGEEIGVFYFRPTDIGIIDRYNSMIENFKKIIAPLENMSIGADGSVEEDDEKLQELMQEAKNSLFEACNFLFDGNFAEAFFGSMHPFSFVNGRFYCENVIEAVGEYISRQCNREVKKMNNRVNRYTHGYRTGKHKDGKK